MKQLTFQDFQTFYSGHWKMSYYRKDVNFKVLKEGSLIIMKPNYFPAVVKKVNQKATEFEVFVFDKETTVYRKDVFIPEIPIFHVQEYIQYFLTEEREFVLSQVIKKDYEK